MQKNYQKLFSYVLVFLLVFSNLLAPTSTFTVAAAEQETEALSVEEALAQTQGTVVTMKGVIIAGFNGEYALEVADSTSSSTSIVVKLEPGQRAQFSPVNNADALNKEIIVTGKRDVYSGKESIEYVTSIEFTDGQPTEPPTTEEPPTTGTITIQEARNLPNNTVVTIKGIVTADNSAIGGGKLSTYIQDDNAGINLYHSTSQDLEEGQMVKVTGKLAEYKGLKEVIPSTIEILESNVAVPQPRVISLSDLQDSAIAESLEGQLVKVEGYVSSVPSSPAGGGYNVSIIDADLNSTTLRVMEGTDTIDSLVEGKWYEVTAIVSQYDSYQILPRKATDIMLLDEQPEAPSAAGEYPATVSNVVDGDTINIESPVLGSTKVRFLNIDTPETYNARSSDPERAEISANQKELGEAAKTYMNTLLKSGDKITLKIGQEATDAYGRLLAQVITSDGDNVNLEMVREGYAVTYFIAPIGEETTYNEFQAALKAAKDHKKGIWNPEKPLLELPFVFRTNDEQDEFDKYVGHSDTKVYVSPEKWSEIPVEKRVFFWSEEDAIGLGYKAEGNTSPEVPTDEDPNGSDDNISLQFLSLNDLHGKIDQSYEVDTNNDGTEETVGRMDYVAAYLKEREALNTNTLIVHAGDMIGGSSPVSALLQDEPTIEIMEAIGFDFGTVGNHEFDEGTEELLRIVNGGEHSEGKGTVGYDGIDFPTLCANCMSKETHEPILPPYAIYEVEGVKVGFIGVNTKATATMVIPSGIEDIYFSDEATAVDKAVEELQSQGIEAIIVLSHMPASQSGTSATGDAANLANSVNDAVDIIYAAHNHEIVNAMVDNKLIVQALDYGKAFADVDIEIDPTTKDIVKKQAEIVYVDQSSVTPDPTVAAILAKYEEQVAPIMNEVIGVTEYELLGGYGTKGEVGDNALGNLIADGMAWVMNSDFALMNGGGIRDNINAGEITWEELFNVQPFGNTLVKLDITGAELEQIINAQISAQYGPDVSVGGFKYTWDGSTNRVVDLFLPDGSKVDPAGNYTITVNNFMYEKENDSYKLRALGENPVQGPIDLDATVDFVKSFNNQPLKYVAEGRISEIIPEPGEDLGNVTIAEARSADLGTVVTVEAVVTSTPGAWGSKGFYIQDGTSGAYVFETDSHDVVIGDKITVTAETRSYNGEFQLADVSSLEKVETSNVPPAKVVSPIGVNSSNEGELVKIQGVKITNLVETNSYGTFEFTATKGEESVLVRVDNRTGLKFDNFSFKEGNVVDVIGVSGQFNGTIQLKPRMVEDIMEAEETSEPENPTPPVVTPTPTPAPEPDEEEETPPTKGEVKLENGASRVENGVQKVDGTKAAEAIAAAKEKVEKVSVELNKAAQSVELPVNIFVKLKENNEKAAIEIKSEKASYTLPISELNLEANAKNVEIIVKEVSAPSGFDSGKLVSAVIDFSVVVKSDNRDETVSRFTQYVSRTITIPSTVNPARAVAVRIQSDGSFTAIPTVFEGNSAVIKSRTNSQYAIIEVEKTFSDVNNGANWAEAYIETLSSKQIVFGKTADLYAPDANMTRGEFAALIARSLGLSPTGNYNGQFTDVSGNEAVNKHGEIMAAFEAGIIKGRADGSFKPGDQITRAEAAIMIARALEFVGYDETKLDATKDTKVFVDSNSISATSKDSIELVSQAGIMNGMSGGVFKPNDYTKRDQLAKIIAETLKFVELMN